jgi:hypothetical protein
MNTNVVKNYLGVKMQIKQTTQGCKVESPIFVRVTYDIILAGASFNI